MTQAMRNLLQAAYARKGGVYVQGQQMRTARALVARGEGSIQTVFGTHGQRGWFVL